MMYNVLQLTVKLGKSYLDFLTGRRKLKVSVRVSSPTSAKFKDCEQAAKTRKEFTGVAAARGGHRLPQSTNVSSPVYMASNIRKGKNPYIDDEAEEDENEEEEPDNYGFEDGFVVPDGHISTEDEEDDFEPVRKGNRRLPLHKSKRELGPRIMNDVRLTEANLSSLHLDIIQQFVQEAKKLDEKIRNDRGIRKPIFHEKQLREMCINWTLELKDIKAIEGVNQVQVDSFGPKFVALTRRFHNDYDAMMRRNEDRDMDQNHQNVIDLVSDNDDGLEGESDEDEAYSQGETSQFFESHRMNAATQAFNAQLAEMMPESTSRPGNDVDMPARQTMSQSTTRGGKGSRGGRGGARKNYPRKSAGESSTSSASRGRVRKRPSSGGGKRNSTGNESSAPSRRGGGAKPPARGLPVERRGGPTVMSRFVSREGRGGGGAPPGFGMMPTK